jgi:peptidoglycan/LPS O-acetylase OafA/YrhL
MPALDGLRGAAVAGVLLFHAGHLRGGYLGVDLFFVLSGFLITSLLLLEGTGRGRIALGAFWARRARRLFPALAAVLLAVAAYAWLVAQPSDLAQIRADGIATLGYVANWRSVFADVDYWSLFVDPSPLQHTWSLAIEEQFYVLWPLVVWGLLRWRGRGQLARSILVLAAAGAGVSVLLMVTLYGDGDRTRVYFGTDTRAGSILVGAALAAALSLTGPIRRRWSRAAVEGAAVAGAVVLAVAWTSLDGGRPALYRGGMFVCALAAAAIIAAATSPTPGPVARVLAVAPLRGLGLISYGVYLWHWPIYLLLDEERTGLGGWTLVVVRVAATLAVSIASYRLLELPIRHGALRPRTIRVLALSSAGVVVAALVVTTVGARPAPEATVSRDDLALARAAFDRAPPNAERMVVVGNSVGLLLGQAFEEIEPEDPIVVANRARQGCTFPTATRLRLEDGSIFQQPLFDCTTTWEEDVASLDPDVVLFSMSDVSGGELEYDGRWLRACTPEHDRLYLDALGSSLDTLASHGATVVVVSPVPAGFSTARGKEHTRCVNELNRQIADERPDTVFVDLVEELCPGGGPCRTHLDGVELRPDTVHFSGEGGRIVARWVLEDLRRQR